LTALAGGNVEGDRFGFVDAHIHFYDLQHPELRYSWLEPDFVHPVIGNINGIKALEYFPANYQAETRFAGVVGAVHVQAALGSLAPERESDFVEEVAREWELPFVLVGDARMQSPDVERTLAEHATHPRFRGIRDFAQGDYLVDPDFHRGYGLLAKYGMSFDLDAVWQDCAKAAALAAKFPDTKLILCHAGYPQERTDEYFADWRRGLEELAGQENALCKISGLGMVDQRWSVETLRPWVLGCIEAFGVDRCMFGTNWPVDRLFSSYPDLVSAYRSIVADFTAEEQRRLFADNARRWYRL
jgi:predicted TIM-barrel fold metal-dependent hydrolase